ncbi:MAG TPA: glycosyltransferase family 4 protein [Solirubrobacteraceae bacterium]|nr:glycosyltransferase family 4 protein [Solirubrobacteraceae bacterium]
MRIQLWSYNYDPEPTGIAPISTVWTQAMRQRGHDVSVVAAHAHYPLAQWGTRLMPYREVRDGVPILRLPLWVGRDTGRARIRQELSFMGAMTAAVPFLEPADVVVAVSPSFPALLAPMIHRRLRRTPWVLWLQDILPDGAESTGLVRSGAIISAARRLELAAYRSAARVVVISHTFAENLKAKGVREEQMVCVRNPATFTGFSPRARVARKPRVLVMGNIGRSQGLSQVIDSFQQSAQLRAIGAELVITGHGVMFDEVRDRITSRRVKLLGLVSQDRLEQELQSASVALVSLLHTFNLPSKLMNYMARGLPVVAFAPPHSEVARLVQETGCGWTADIQRPELFGPTLAHALTHEDELHERGERALARAREEFDPFLVAERFDRVLHEVVEAA